MAVTTNSMELKFQTAEGNTTTFTMANAKAGLDADTVRTAMTAMVDSQAFATTQGVAYDTPLSAAYITRSVETLFEDKEA